MANVFKFILYFLITVDIRYYFILVSAVQHSGQTLCNFCREPLIVQDLPGTIRSCCHTGDDPPCAALYVPANTSQLPICISRSPCLFHRAPFLAFPLLTIGPIANVFILKLSLGPMLYLGRGHFSPPALTSYPVGDSNSISTGKCNLSLVSHQPLKTSHGPQHPI